jgi:hypothetical protein
MFVTRRTDVQHSPELDSFRINAVAVQTNHIGAIAFAVLSSIVAVFQLALAAGAPWGDLTLGGQFPGTLPTGMRVAACVQAGVLMALAVLVLARSGLLFPSMFRVSRWLVWVAVLVCLLSLSLNLTTGTKWERRFWVPVLFGMVVSSVIVALSPSGRVTTTDGEEPARTD